VTDFDKKLNTEKRGFATSPLECGSSEFKIRRVFTAGSRPGTGCSEPHISWLPSVP
jgi:hypothetical protein